MRIWKSQIGERRKILRSDTSGIAPLVLLLALGIMTAGAVAVGYVAFAKPDITYNISEGLFSFAGVDVSVIMMIGIVIVSIFAMLFFFRKK